MLFSRALLAVAACVFAAGTALAQRAFVLPEGTTGDGTVRAFTTNPFAPAGTFEAPAATVTILSSPAGDRLYAIDEFGTLNVLNGTSYAVISTREVGQVNGAVLSPDGRWLLLASAALPVYETTNMQQTLLDVGSTPDDVAFSIDGTRAYAVDREARRLTVVDMTQNPPRTITTNVGTVTGGTTPAFLTVSPTGAVYVAVQNRIYEFDRNGAFVGQIAFLGSPSRMILTPDLQYGVVANLELANGGTLMRAFDLRTRTVAGTLNPPTANSRAFDTVVYGGKHTNGQHRFYALSSAEGALYEVQVPSMQRNQVTAGGQIGTVYAIATTGEITTPQYLLVASSTGLHRIDIRANNLVLAGTQTIQGTPDGIVVAAGANTAGTPASVLAYNSGQSLAAGSNQRYAQLIFRVLDATGRPVANTPVTFSSVLALEDRSTTTNNLGYAFVTAVAPSTGGTYTVTASAGTASANATLTATGGGGPVDPGNPGTTGGVIPISGSGQIVVELRPLTEPLGVEVRDSSGTPIEGATVTFTLSQQQLFFARLSPFPGVGTDIPSASCSSVLLCTAVTNELGRAGVGLIPQSVDASRIYEQVVVTATATKGGAQYGSRNLIVTILDESAIVELLPVKPADLFTEVSAAAGSVTPDAIRMRASVRTVFSGVSRALPNVGLRVETPAGGPTAECVGGIIHTDQNGIASCNLQGGGTEGVAPLTIRFGNRSWNTTVRLTAPLFTSIVIEQGNNQSGQAGSTLPVALRVQVRNAAGNGVASVPVQWTVVSANTGITLQNVTTSTDANGRSQATVRLGNTTGTFQIRATAGAQVANFTVTVTAAPPPVTVGSVAVLSGGDQSAEINTDFANPIRFVVRDQNGAVLANQAVTFTTTGGGTLSAASATTNAQGEVEVRLRAGATTGALTVVATSGGRSATANLTARPVAPTISVRQLLNGAGFYTQTRVAPGQILTITGTGFATGITGVRTPDTIVGPLPTQLAGVRVLFNGVAAPIYHVANMNGTEQVTVQVPFEIPAGSTRITIDANGVSGSADNVQVGDVQPGIFETQTGDIRHGVVIRESDGSYISPQNPARPGDVLRMYATGLGVTTPAARTNAPAIGGQTVPAVIIVGVNYAGVVVRGAEYVDTGVYLVTFEVPANAPSGQRIPLNMALIGSDNNLYYTNVTSLAIQ